MWPRRPSLCIAGADHLLLQVPLDAQLQVLRGVATHPADQRYQAGRSALIGCCQRSAMILLVIGHLS